jgi:hypothetical protein
LIGPNYQGILKGFIRGYLIDILLPLNLYLLLQLSLRKRLAVKNARIIAALFVFTFGVFVEVLQFYQVAIFGTTYDPRDIVMYGVGVGSGVLIDLTVINYFESR